MLLFKGKDGGLDSRVWGYWFIELKQLFSIVLLRFEDGSRDAYHNHAFNCFSWVLWGKLIEQHLSGAEETHKAGWLPFVTRRETFHKVTSIGRTWVLSFRGPWAKEWSEFIPGRGEVRMTHGRREL